MQNGDWEKQKNIFKSKVFDLTDEVNRAEVLVNPVPHPFQISTLKNFLEEKLPQNYKIIASYNNGGENSTVLRSFVKTYTNSADVYINSSNMNYCWSRFCMVKEFMHILTALTFKGDFLCNIDHLNRWSEIMVYSNIYDEEFDSDDIVDKKIQLFENLCLQAATRLIIPKSFETQILPSYKENSEELVEKTAELYKIPRKCVDAYCREMKYIN